MTFDKYKQGREKFNDYIFPDDEYLYTYEWNKDIGWHIVRGMKISDLPNQEWDIKIPKEVNE